MPSLSCIAHSATLHLRTRAFDSYFNVMNSINMHSSSSNINPQQQDEPRQNNQVL
jgi:hypothetical protein